MSKRLIETIAATAEIFGHQLLAEALDIFASDLSKYPENAVLSALEKLRTESTGRFTVADIVLRIDDGRPKAEEAWAMMPKSEDDTVVWNDELAAAFSACSGLMGRDDVAARMAFKEVYEREVLAARRLARPVKWWASLGHNPRGRESALRDAIEKGRLSAEDATRLIPDLSIPKISEEITKRLGTDAPN